MKMLHKVGCCLMAAGALSASAVTLQVDRIKPRTQFGLVDIDYTVALGADETLGIDDCLEVGIVDKSVSPAVTNRANRFLQAPLSIAPGSHRITWDAKGDGVANVTDDMEFVVRIVRYAPTYLVIDVSGGSATNAYPTDVVSGAQPGDFNAPEYKGDKIVLRRIRPGSYVAGSLVAELELGHDATQERQHRVTLTQPFYIGLFEVTQKQYKNVTGSEPAAHTGEFRPVERVSYEQIRGTGWPTTAEPAGGSFMDKLIQKCKIKDGSGAYAVSLAGFDLPTEFQWEYACRAGTTKAFNRTDDFDNTVLAEQTAELELVGRYADNQSKGAGGNTSKHTVVGSYQANAWGLYDMHGNVWEWCRDWFVAAVDGLGQSVDPTGPATAQEGARRAVRGGSHGASVANSRSGFRGKDTQTNAAGDRLGFRISLSVPPSAASDVRAAVFECGASELAATTTACSARTDYFKARLPQGGAFFSYLQSFGDQYVNTHYCMRDADAVDCWIDLAAVQPSKTDSLYPTIFGAALNNNANRYILQAKDKGVSNKSNYRRNGLREESFDTSIPSERIVRIACAGRTAQWFGVDGTLGGSMTTAGETSGDSRIPLLIFQNNYASTDGGVLIHDNWWCNMKLYGFTIASGSAVTRDLRPYRAPDGRTGLWDIAPNADPNYDRFYPNASGSGASFAAGGVSYLPSATDGGTVCLLEGMLDCVTPLAYWTVEKTGTGTVHAEAVTTYTNLKLTEGTLSFADGSAQTVSAEKLILSGGAILDVDLMDGGCDAFQVGSVDLSAASAANPVRVRVPADPSREGTFTLIDAGLSDGDEAKFASADLSVPLTFAVKDGALEMTLSKYVPVVKATWTNAKGDGNIADPGNWLCLDGADQPIDDVLPTRVTDVRLSGECVFSCPVGSTFQCRSLALDGVSLADDCDWRGLPVPFEGTVDVKGRRLDVSSFDGAATVTDSVGGGELHANIPFGVQASTASVTLTGKLKLVKDGLGALVASKTGQTYSGGTEIVAGTFACGGPGIDRGYGAAGSTVTVRSGACFNLDGYSNHYEYTIVLDGGTLTSTTERGNMSHAWLKHVVLTADSVLSTASCLGLVANGYSDTTIELGGHTLAVQCIGTNPADVHFYMCNLTVSGGGTLRFTGGGLLRLGNNFKTNGGSDGMYVHGADVTLDIRDMGIDCTLGDVSFANYTSSYSGSRDSGSGPIKVSGRFTPGPTYHATQLGNGATIDLSGCSGTLDGAKLSYATDAVRINVDFGSRVPRPGTKVIGWTAGTKPVGKVKFKSKSCGLSIKDDGLYVGPGLALILY